MARLALFHAGHLRYKDKMQTVLQRNLAIDKIKLILGQDLRPMADTLGVTVRKGDKPNKGWAGHVLERYLDLKINSAQQPDGGDWELKIIPLKMKEDLLIPKETMAITMINPEEVVETPFEKSHMFNKLKSLIICGRIFEAKTEPRSILHSVGGFDLHDPQLLATVKEDYETVQNVIRKTGFVSLTGRMGTLVQPRTKGPGHGSISRAFYARKALVSIILGTDDPQDES